MDFDDDMDEEIALDKLKEMVDEAPIIRVVNYILNQAITDGATAVRIDPAEKCIDVYYKVNDEWQHIMTPPKHIQEQVIDRFRELTEDDALVVECDGSDYVMQVSFFSTEHGEGVLAELSDGKAKLLERLEQFEEAEVDQKGFILEEIVTQLGELCRLGRLEEAMGREVMTQLVDLQHALEAGESGAESLAAVRALLSSS
jgi:type II secretory ATPase GspE/PulE/Tfp pilus assembly ATPase PilB-like protein